MSIPDGSIDKAKLDEGVIRAVQGTPRMPGGDLNSYIYGGDRADGLFLPWFRRWKVPHEEYITGPPIDPQWLYILSELVLSNEAFIFLSVPLADFTNQRKQP